MTPKSARKCQEGERLEQSLRKLDKEMRRLSGVEDFHHTKSKEVRAQLTKIGAVLARASTGAAEKRAALALAQRELDLATSQEAQAKRDGERLTLQLGEHEAFALSAKGDTRNVKVQRDRAARDVKDHWAKAAVVGLWSQMTLAGHLSQETRWPSRGTSWPRASGGQGSWPCSWRTRTPM